MSTQDQQQDEQKVDFIGLILGFSSAALTYLGYTADGQKSEVNLELARQNIDIIKLLKEKTQGNRNEEEDKLLNQIIPDLMMKYSECADKKKP